jgi:hypothetical protein
MFFFTLTNEVSVLPGLITGGYLELILTLAKRPWWRAYPIHRKIISKFKLKK